MGRGNYQHLPLTETLIDSDRTDSQRYDTRMRARHTLKNGWSMWATFDEELIESIFELSDMAKGVEDKVDKEDIDEIRELRQGLIGWLALLYAGIETVGNIHLARLVKLEEGEGGPAFTPYDTNTSYRGGETLSFEFETLLEEAVRKVVSKRGEKVTEVTIETEPMYNSDTQDLVARFEAGEPLGSDELVQLIHEREIGHDELDQYLKNMAV